MNNNYIKSMMQYAEQDYNALDILYQKELYNLVVFHSQQCIEKA